MTHLDTYLSQMAMTLQRISHQPLGAIADALWDTYDRDGTIIICGNGGSASTASHLACDLAKWTARPGVRRVRALALTDNVPILTAYGNDQGYADVFVEQLRALYRPGDTIFAISGSGNSPNVLRAIEWANEQGALTIGLTGFDGGRLAHMARVGLRVDNYLMPQVEDAHSTICHALAVNLGRQIDVHLSEVSIELHGTKYLLLEKAVGEREP